MVITTEYPLSVVFSYRPGTVNSVCTLIAHAIANPIPTQSHVSIIDGVRGDSGRVNNH
jgi:hypothetical protein